jgi:hypothetical protein
MFAAAVIAASDIAVTAAVRRPSAFSVARPTVATSRVPKAAPITAIASANIASV